MSQTDDLINRRRGGQENAERREFSVDRGQAIRKMRQFALEDPGFYLLELIQAAIANGGGFLNIDLFRLYRDQDDLKMWWGGRGFSQFELERLFDFLLVSDDDPGCADTILLARGVNAMMHFKPTRITISSGDGTLAGSTQVVITGDGKIKEQEVPEAVSGVRIHGERLNLSLLTPRPDQQLGDREVEMLRDKVIAPGVQVMLNGHFISDWNSAHFEQRHWETESVEIDEEDLYGRLWVSPFGGPGEFDIMTWGVKIERLERDEPSFLKLYGAVNFNRLNKTADHAKIVRDEVLDELWARLRPYADRLQSNGSTRAEVTYGIGRLDGTKFRPPELVELLRTHERVVVVRGQPSATSHAGQIARDIGRALEAPVLVVPDSERQTLEMLAGGSVEFVQPRLDDARDVQVLTGPAASAPPRPWLAEPMKVEPISAGEFVQQVCDEHRIDDAGSEQLASMLAGSGRVHIHVYSPGREPTDSQQKQTSERLQTIHATLLVCEREVFRGEYPSMFSGHELFIDLPPVSPSLLFETVFCGATDTHEPIVELAAKTGVQLARHRIEQAHERAEAALRRLSGEDVEESAESIYIDEEAIEEHRVRGVIGLPHEPVDEFAIELVEAESGRVHKLYDLAQKLRLVGQLAAYDDRVIDSKAWLEEVIVRHGEQLLDRLARRLPKIEDATERERVAATLLDFAGQKLAFHKGADGRVHWEVDNPLARRILAVPLFRGRHGVPVSPLRIIRQLCTVQNAGRDTVSINELLAEDVSVSVHRWLETYLDLSGLEKTPSDSAEAAQIVIEEPPPKELLAAVEALLMKFRPDQQDSPPLRDVRLKWMSRHEPAPDWVRVRPQPDYLQVDLDPTHPLVERAKRQATPEAMSWLLLAIYAEINTRLEPVTNDHELRFQRRVADALESDELVALLPGHLG
jgi:hypothetical protein